MADTFQLASGSVTGAQHVNDSRPNQDAHCILRTPTHTIVVVADGCSEGEHSEVGAHLGVRYAARAAQWALDFFVTTPNGEAASSVTDDGMDHVWTYIREHVREGITESLGQMGRFSDHERRPAVNDLFLFTLVVGIIDHRPGGRTTFAAIGDGFLAVNGATIPFPKFPGNKPPYVAYLVVTSSIAPDLLNWKMLHTMPTAELQSFVIATDGMDDFVEHEHAPMPGSSRPVGPLSQFWEEDRYITNRDMVRRKLVVCNGGVGPRASRGGLLRDDTTLVVGRRTPCSP